MALVMGTLFTLAVSLIVAMPMEWAFVAEFFPSSLTAGGNMIDLNHVSFFEMQSTPAACAGLLLQELAFNAAQEVVFTESLTPIHEISVVWAGCSFHFDMPLDMGLRVIPQGD
jgi:hypothetical protein